MAKKGSATATKIKTPRNTAKYEEINKALRERWGTENTKTLGRGIIHKWDEGVEVEGEFQQIRDNEVNKKKAFLLEIKVRGELQTWACPTILYNRLTDDTTGEGIPSKDEIIYIACIGKVSTRNAQAAWDFYVARKE